MICLSKSGWKPPCGPVRALYRAIARSIPGGGVYVVDKDFRYLVAEGPVTEAFGLSREMLEGHTVAEVFPDERGKGWRNDSDKISPGRRQLRDEA